MYLEERVEQVESLTVDQGRQIEAIAKGVADLTVTVNHRFDRVDQRFDRIEGDISSIKADVNQFKADVNQRFDRVEADIAELKSGQARLEVTVTDIQQTQHDFTG